MLRQIHCHLLLVYKLKDHRRVTSQIWSLIPNFMMIFNISSVSLYSSNFLIVIQIKNFFSDDGTLSLSSPEKLLFKNEEKTLRHHLPVQMVQCNFSMWSVLKQAIGKDLSKISFPIEMFEPLSVLQVIYDNYL